MRRRVDPLSWNVPIVDPQGLPTKEFMRQWIAQNDKNKAVDADLQDIADAINEIVASTFVAGTGLNVSGTFPGVVTYELENTAVTPGSYTNADITVDAQGRITAAANGAPPPADAGDVTFTPYGDIVATNVQEAIEELDDEKVAKAGDTMTGELIIEFLSGNHFNIIRGNASAGVHVERYQDNTGAPNFTGYKARGTMAAPSNALTNDNALIINARVRQASSGGPDNDGFFNTAQINATLVDPSPSPTSLGGRWTFRTVSAGSATMVDRLIIDNGVYTPSATGGDMGNGTVNATEYYKNGVPLSGGGGGIAMPWELISDTTVGPTTANVDFTSILAGYEDVYVEFIDVTCSASATRGIRLSTDGGSSYFAGGSDYAAYNTSGAATLVTGIEATGASTSARSGGIQINGFSRNGVKQIIARNTLGVSAAFLASTSPIDGIRAMPFSGNMTGGSVRVWGRKPGTSLGWTRAAVWDHSVSGNTAIPLNFNGLGAVNEIMIICRGVTKSSSSQFGVRVSDNNGSSYYSTSGNYVNFNAGGTQTNVTSYVATSASATTAQTFIARVMNVTNGPAIIEGSGRSEPSWVAATTSPINAVSIISPSGTPLNLTAGTIEVWTR